MGVKKYSNLDLETPQTILFIVQRRCFYYIDVGSLFERKKIELALTTSISLNLRNQNRTCTNNVFFKKIFLFYLFQSVTITFRLYFLLEKQHQIENCYLRPFIISEYDFGKMWLKSAIKSGRTVFDNSSVTIV